MGRFVDLLAWEVLYKWGTESIRPCFSCAGVQLFAREWSGGHIDLEGTAGKWCHSRFYDNPHKRIWRRSHRWYWEYMAARRTAMGAKKESLEKLLPWACRITSKKAHCMCYAAYWRMPGLCYRAYTSVGARDTLTKDSHLQVILFWWWLAGHHARFRFLVD